MGRIGAGTLFVVATPIGNLEDITLRALRVLREVALVAAEDTRRTGNLLRHYEIRTPLLSVHEHNERQRLPQLIARLAAGESIALVTDAGTPGISDPGAHVVAAVREQGFRIEPIPGPSSVVSALSVAGQPTDRFAFLGFPSIRSKDRKQFFDRVAALADFLVVIFEAPHRVLRTLADLDVILVNRPIIIARELTKTHEEVFGGSHAELIEHLKAPKGEITILICPAPVVSGPAREVSDTEIAAIFGETTKFKTLTRRETIREVSQRTGLAPRAVFQALERIKKIGHTT